MYFFPNFNASVIRNIRYYKSTRQCLFTETRDESTQGGQTTSKLLNVMHTHMAFHSEDGINFFWIGIDPSFGNEKTV